MRLFSQSGTSNARLDVDGLSAELLNVSNIVSPHLVGLELWKIGIVFVISDIRLQVNLKNSVSSGIIPEINFEDSTATRLSRSVEARNSSQRVGLEFSINSNSLGIIELKNYNIVYNLSILGRFGREGKILGDQDLISANIIDLGYGVLTPTDYIDISVDYIFEFDGFKPNEDLLLRFE